MSIRLRLAIWYTAVLTGTLILFGLLLYFLMERHMKDQVDESIISRAHHLAGAVVVDRPSPDGPFLLSFPSVDVFEAPGIYIQVDDEEGNLVARSQNLGRRTLPVDLEIPSVLSGDSGILTSVVLDNENLRLFVRPIIFANHPVGYIEVARSNRDSQEILAQLRLVLVAAGVFSIAIAGLMGWAIAGRALSPVATITHTARAIALSRGFSRRLANTYAKDELGELGVTFNEMLASLEEAYSTQQRFIADASHELRTPLTSVRANLELLERQGGRLSGEERQEMVKAALAEADRMSRLVADLLVLARADAGQSLELRPTELDRLLLDVYKDARLLAQSVRVKVTDIEEVKLLADPDRLKQLILILVDNAIRYTPAGGEVSLGLTRNHSIAILTVSDTGIGISSEDLPLIFDRFYRADKARAKEAAGTGLGLAIAKWIVEQHGGSIDAKSTLGQGTVFKVHLPLAP